MNVDKVVAQIGCEFDAGGFLYDVKYGKFNMDRAFDFVALIRSIDLANNHKVPVELVRLLWLLPAFLWWHINIVEHNGYNVDDYKDFIYDIIEAFENVLECPKLGLSRE